MAALLNPRKSDKELEPTGFLPSRPNVTIDTTCELVRSAKIAAAFVHVYPTVRRRAAVCLDTETETFCWISG